VLQENKIKKLENLLNPVAEKENVEITDIEYVKEDGAWILRIFIDKENGVNMNDCERVSRAVSAILDDNEILQDSYILEVSSPGLDRIIKKEKDFKRFMGCKIRLQTFETVNGQKNFLGEIINFENNKLTINDVTKGAADIDFSQIKRANLEPDV
jgi:ribosome maturation factor RimP